GRTRRRVAARDPVRNGPELQDPARHGASDGGRYGHRHPRGLHTRARRCRAYSRPLRSRLTRMARAYIGLGTNLGDRRRNLELAVAELQRLGRVDALSTVYQSEPIGYLDQPDFWNLVARLETEL